MSRTNPNFRLSCPNPYTFDETSGLCVEPTPPGFTLRHGRFFRNCPPGMTPNDLGTCIRPVMSRSSFINEKNIQNTSLAFGSSNGTLVWGSYDSKAYDMAFDDSTQLSNNSINDIFLSPGSDGLFFVAQNNVAKMGLTTIGTKGQPGAQPVIDTNSDDHVTDNSTLKIQYSNQMDQMFLLAKPQTEIFNVSYSASLNKLKAKMPADGISVSFNPSTYSVSNLTEPFYVGSYSYLNYDPGDQTFLFSSYGALQDGLDAVENQQTVPQPMPDTQTPGCLITAYDPQRPADPVPSFFVKVTDVNSRNITSEALTSGNGSIGYVIVGDIEDAGSGYAIRYIDNDPCVLSNNAQPFLQFFAKINLGFSGGLDVRTARFDCEEITLQGPTGPTSLGPDTFYLFGSSPGTVSGPVLSFITENKQFAAPGTGGVENFNGLSVGDVVNNDRSNTRSEVNATVIENILGYGIETWNYNPITQSLIFSVAQTASSSSGFGSDENFTTRTYTFSENSTFQVPSNCVSVQAFLWGGGGSCDALSGGYGGAGAFVGGYLKTVNEGTVIKILVGEGGGAPNRVGLGSGGGRSALSINGQDYVTAGGGGGSVGRGRGGAASASAKQAESGSPGLNGGVGASTKAAGRGGKTFGDPRIQKVNDGKLGYGGNSYFAISKSAVGGGAGGGGYFGGGSGAYLGYTNNINDVPTGGGGGSSFSENIFVPILLDGQGPNAPNTTSPYYDLGAAAGGTPENGIGGPGLVVLIVITTEDSNFGAFASEQNPQFSSPIYLVQQGRFKTQPDSTRGAVKDSSTVTLQLPSTTDLFTNVVLSPPLGSDTITATYSGANGLVIVVTSSTTVPFKLFWAFATGKEDQLTLKQISAADAQVFGPIPNTPSVSITNVTGIRQFDTLSTTSTDLMFLGNGIRVVTPPKDNAGTWTNPRYVSRPDDTLDLNNVTIIDAQFNDTTQMIEAIAVPAEIGISTVHKTPYAPVFASFYNQSDISAELAPWIGTGSSNALLNQPGVILESILPATLPSTPPPNTLLYVTYSPPVGPDVTSLLTIYQPVTTDTPSTPIYVAQQLQLALTAFLTSLSLPTTPAVSAEVDFTNVLSLLFTSMPLDSNISLVFTGSGPLVPALAQASRLLGFSNPSVQVGQQGQFREIGLSGSSPIFLQPASTEATGVPTPISVSFPVNDAFPGSIYHVYAPQVRLAGSGNTVVAVGGPFADPSNSAINSTDSSGQMNLPRSIRGTQYYIDFAEAFIATSGDKTYNWTAYEVGPTRTVVDPATIAVRSPANILWSVDNGSSYNFAKSTYDNSVSSFAMTGLDMYHTFGDGSSNVFKIGPAKFTNSGNQGIVNAAVSQFNDIKYYEYEGSGVYIAVGQFIWELNSMFELEWPNDVANLRGCAWASLDGITWTTIFLNSPGMTEPFWIVYKTDLITNSLIALLTDLGLYSFSLDAFIAKTKTALARPALVAGEYSINLMPLANTGPYAASCKDRNPLTGTCIKCEDGSATIIPQIIGEGGTIEPSFDTCIKKPEDTSITYFELEAGLDGSAIGAYAGFIGKKPTQAERDRIQKYRQSFVSSSLFSNTVFICPLHVDPDITPSTVIGQDAYVSQTMQCELSPLLSNSGNKNGLTIVRRPVQAAGLALSPPQVVPDITYDSTKYQEAYAYEARIITTVPYDSYSTGGVPPVLPDTCPSTLGIGGSAIEPPYGLLGNYEAYGPLSSDLLATITNKSRYDPSLSGPFYVNQSIISIAGANWNINAPPDRAVLANEGDLLSDFSYANGMVFNVGSGASGASGFSGPFGQEPNPYLFRLSSFPFPYDGMSTVNPQISGPSGFDPDEDPLTTGPSGAASGPALNPGRDPQVYEPGYGPLLRYLNYSEPGFPVENEAWPVNPLPEEGFGTWWIRGIPNNDANNPVALGMFQAQLGFGSLVIGSTTRRQPQTIQTLPLNFQSPYTSLRSQQTIRLFNYDLTSTATVAEYLGQNSWTAFLPYAGPNAYKNDATDANRSAYAKFSIQNVLALKLKVPSNAATNAVNVPTNNWQYLVSTNFLRPRNWAFANLVGSAQVIGNNVQQVELRSDQPDAEGRYEFLVPDPYFAKFPMIASNRPSYAQGSVVGLVSSGAFFAAAIAAYKAQNQNHYDWPNDVTLIEGSADTLAMAGLHNAFHYWTAKSANTFTLDLYVNVTKLLLDINYSWLQRGQSALPDAIVSYMQNPLISFTYFDPTAQTTRSVQSLIQDGSLSAVQVPLPNVRELVYAFLNETNFNTRVSSPNVVTGLYDFNTVSASLIHHQFTITLNSSSATSLINSNNFNSAVAFNQTASGPLNAAISGPNQPFVPAPDIRAGITSAQNYKLSNAINVLASNYDIELDVSRLYAQGLAPIRQDYLAQDPMSVSSLHEFGHPVWGFGLRIDPQAVKPEVTILPTLATNAALPAHHGYVTMVRTIIDSFGRFGLPESPDAAPHQQRLTYITKYVPSKLQNYGAIVPYAPMTKALNSISPPALQNILNPFRPVGSFFVQNASLRPWARLPFFVTGSVFYYALSSLDADIEGPGFYGRQPFNVDDSITDPNGPAAGYEGVVDGAFMTVADTVTSSQSFRTLPIAIQNSANLLTSSIPVNYVPSGKAVVGQMLLDLGQLTGAYAPNVSYNINTNSLPVAGPAAGAYPVLTSVNLLTPLLQAYNAKFTNNVLTSFVANTFVTHIEFLSLFCTAFNSAVAGVTLSATFDTVNDRPIFTVVATTGNIYRFILNVSTPMNNWLGLRSVKPLYFTASAAGLGSITARMDIESIGNTSGSPQYVNIRDTTGSNLAGVPVSMAQLNDVLRQTMIGIGGFYTNGTGSTAINYNYPTLYKTEGFPVTTQLTTKNQFNYTFIGNTANGYCQMTVILNSELVSILSGSNSSYDDSTGDNSGYRSSKFMGSRGSAYQYGFVNISINRPTPPNGSLHVTTLDSTIWNPADATSNGYYKDPLAAAGSTGQPCYSLFYEHSNNNEAWRQPSSLSGTKTFSGYVIDESNITNVSFTTRLSAKEYPYSWGLACGAFGSTASFYEANASLIASQNGDGSFVQNAPTNQFISPFSALTPFVSYASASFEVPSSLGSGLTTNIKAASYDVSTGFPIITQQAFAANPTSGTQGPPINYILAQYNLNHVTDNTFNNVNNAFSPAQSMSTAITADPSILKMTQSSASAIQGPNVILSVSEPCYLNIGAMPSQNQSTQRMAFYVFNYSDLLASQSPVTFGTPLSYALAGSKTYLPAQPYFVDELYDSAAFSALGRSILLDNSTISSLVGPTPKALTFSTSDPVIIMFAYASSSAALINTIPVTGSMYSNFLENSFSGIYYSNASTVSYFLKATLPADGALYAFYGLTNTKANDSVALNNTASLPRKRILDFGNNDNDCLGLDIRQVYPSNALTINSIENNSGYLINGPAITGTFRSVSLASPNWANSSAPMTQQFLPLAGTFVQDQDSGQDVSAAQLLPNYDALSLIAEWRPATTSNEPAYQMFAVDRSVVQVPDVPTNQNPFALTNLDMMRPSTKFVKMCDVWRNTLRSSVLVPKEWSQSSNFDGSGVLVSLMDCMGPEMYNATDSINNDYFGMCNGTLVSQGTFNSVSQPSIPGLEPSYTAPNTTGGSPGITPWTRNGLVWSPFTGGSYWNTFDPNSAADSNSTDPVHYRFSPQLWFPTYGWLLGAQDVNNVWPTSIATNANLLANNQAVFSSTDGSIRKMTLGTASSPSAVTEITGPTTFFNNGINLTGINFVESFVNPGRIYNLTYWSENWWFTADTASVWTTAPTSSGIVLCDPIFIEQFFTPGIKFRPLSVEEGHPESWSNKSWPTNEAHRFNVMKVIQYEGAEALFVSSIDGEYMILTRNGTSFTSVVNNESFANLFLPSGPSGPSGASGSLYITDILLSNQNIAIASLPLPIDPQQFTVPWADAGLPLLSLGHTPSNANGPVLLLQSQNWSLPLEDSNVIKSTFALPPFVATDDPVDFVTAYADSITPLQTSDGLGLRRIQKPANVKPSDSIMPFLDGVLQNNDIAVGSLLKGYDSGPVINFTMNYTTNVLQSGGVPTFCAAGFDMDLISKAYFSIDGLGPIVNEKSLGLHVINSAQRNVTIESTIAPMFSNSIAFSIKTTPFSANRLTSEFIHPTNGPLSEYAKELNDYASLNIFQNMNVKRTSPVQSNQIITDISYAEELNGLAWTTFGPFGAEGVTIASLNNGVTTLVPKDPNFKDAHFLQQNTVFEWNPYELKWYCAGLANNMYDFGSLVEPDPLLRPSGISVADYAKLVWDPATRALTNNNARLMIVYADASSGLSDDSGAIKFQQVYKLLHFNEGNYIVRPLSRDFDSISCMGFSPSAVVIGGSFNGLARIAHKTGTSIASNDLKAAWALTDLNVSGSVTAIKYVGYAWYITTWDPVLLRSSLFFASLTFAGITSIDSWNTNSTLEITALSAVLPPTTTCTDGYEPDPNNPAVCIKKCPANFETYGTLCVQICPAPFSATGIVNECQPDSKMPNVTVPLARGAAPPISDLKIGPCVGSSCANPDSINWPVMVLSIALTLLVLAFVFGIINAFRSK